MRPRRLLLATDFSAASERAREAAIQLAKTFDADLTVLHVLEPPAYPYPIDIPNSVRNAAKYELHQMIEDLRRMGVRAEPALREGSPPVEIVATVRENALDFVVLGTHGHRGVAHFLLGSVAENVVRLSPVPVLTIPSWHDQDRAVGLHTRPGNPKAGHP